MCFYSGHRAGTVRAPCGHCAGTERALQCGARARAHSPIHTHTHTHTHTRGHAHTHTHACTPEVLSYAAQCLWFDGSVLPIVRPQNVAGMTGHLLYKGTAPIFVTGKLADIEWLHSAALVS